MGKQISDGNVVFTVCSKGRQVRSYGIIQAQLALLEKLHNRGRGHQRLGQRCHVEYRVDRHGFLLRFDGTHAVGFAEDHFSVMADEDDGSRHSMFADRSSYCTVDSCSIDWQFGLCYQRGMAMTQCRRIISRC